MKNEKKTPDKNIISTLTLIGIIGICLVLHAVFVSRLFPHDTPGTKTRAIFYTLTGIEIVSLLFYFAGVLTRVRTRAAQQERRLAQTLYMYDVQQTLFDAHRSPGLITDALQKSAEILTADAAFLLHFDRNSIQEFYIWPPDPQKQNNLPSGEGMRRALPQISALLFGGKRAVFYLDDRTPALDDRDRATLEQHSVHSLMFIPVVDSAGRLTCALGGINMKQRRADPGLLECVARDFQMALTNVSYYRLIHEMGTLDVLTGLKNRNCYEHSLPRYAALKDSSLCCLYIDANGLHELNNHLGHAAGDEMLMFVSNALRTIFGNDHSYRIGGDEFIAFCCGCSQEEVDSRIRKFQALLGERAYHASIGLAWNKDSADLHRTVSVAESRMYEEKRRFYQEKGDVSKAREMNQRLEQILREKKDADSFLSIISDYFKGVLIVDLNTGDTRTIYTPPGFAAGLKQHHHKFDPAVRSYIDADVHPDCRTAFRAFLDYNAIGERLLAGEILKFHYRETDGTPVSLTVYPASDYTQQNKDSFWLLEAGTKQIE